MHLPESTLCVRGRVRKRGMMLCAVAGACASVGTGCQGTTNASPNPAPAALSRSNVSAANAVVGKAFGDSTGFGLRIVTFDRENEQAEVRLTKTAHLIVLAVIPGREIELIHPGQVSNGLWQSKKKSGVSVINVQRFDDGIRANDADDDAKARLAYERCVRDAAATARRIAASKRSVKRDSTGKIIDGGGSTPDPAMERGLETGCDRMATAAVKRRVPKPLPPRTPAERYLVVLASQSSLSEAELTVRLASLSTVAPDVATTIEAIAAGVFVGVPGPWSGYFVAW